MGPELDVSADDPEMYGVPAMGAVALPFGPAVLMEPVLEGPVETDPASGPEATSGVERVVEAADAKAPACTGEPLEIAAASLAGAALEKASTKGRLVVPVAMDGG